MDQRQIDQQEMQARERADLEARHTEEYLECKAAARRALEDLRARHKAEKQSLHQRHTEAVKELAQIVWEDSAAERAERYAQLLATRKAARDIIRKKDEKEKLETYLKNLGTQGPRPAPVYKGPPGPEDSGL